MPEMDGFTLCKKIKSETTSEIPVILLTSLSDPEDVLKGLECGADNFITKPYDGAYLLARINHILINAKLRSDSKLQMGVEIFFKGKKYFINSERQQILDLLLSTYETAMMKNSELKDAQERLAATNDQLEKIVQERTAALLLEIEERRRAEAAAKAERQRLYDVLETLPAMICLLTPDHEVAFVNRAFREKFGESNGRRCHEYCFGNTEPCDFCESYKVLETGKPHHWEVTTPDGKSVIDAYDFPFTDVDGSPLILEMDIDITDRKRAEAELARYRKHLEDLVQDRTIELQSANKELEAFTYSASHDLRAPLRTIAGFAQALAEEYAGKLNEKGNDYLGRIRGGADRMNRLIEDLLRLSRLSRQELERRKLDMSELARTVISRLQESDAGRNVQIAVADSLKVFADPSLLDAALSNLLGNAWKFTSKTSGARIELGRIDRGNAGKGAADLRSECGVKIKEQLDQGKAVYYVRDNGAGFDPAYADKMFLPFKRLHTEKEFEGTGIGLAIVERIIRRHGGTIWAEGAIGKGATVYFTLAQ